MKPFRALGADIAGKLRMDAALVGLFSVFTGVLFLVGSKEQFATACRILGVLLMTAGGGLFAYRLMHRPSHVSLLGVFTFFIGLLVLIYAFGIVDRLMRFLQIVSGVMMLLYGVVGILRSFYMHGKKMRRWGIWCAVSAACLAVGLVITFLPESAGDWLFNLIGISLVFGGVYEIAMLVRTGRYAGADEPAASEPAATKGDGGKTALPAEAKGGEEK